MNTEDNVFHVTDEDEPRLRVIENDENGYL